MRGIFSFDAWAGRLKGRRLQLLVLTRHFFNRFFQNEIVPFETQMKEKLFAVLAALATVGWLLTTTLFSQYMFIQDLGQSWAEKTAFLTMFMVVLAFAVTLEWDIVFPDRRDHLNLTPLPVRRGTFISAKFLAFLSFVVLFSAAANVLSVLGVAFFLPKWISESLGTLILYMGAHILASTAAYLFVFLFFVFLQALFMAIIGPRLFRAISPLIRFLLFIVSVFGILVSIVDARTLQKGIEWIVQLRAARPASALLVPPFWFTGIYESLVGRGDPLYTAGALIGLSAILVLGFATYLAMAVNFRRHIREAIEVRAARVPFAGLRARATAVFDNLALRNPVQRAIFHFTMRTLRASPAHKLRLMGYLAFGLGVILFFFGAGGDLRDPARAAHGLLATPPVLFLFTILGMRSGVNLPYAPEANWIFQVTETGAKRPYFAGLKKAILYGLLLPLSVALFAFFAYFWGARNSLRHVLFGLVWALLAREAALWNYSRVPFACMVVPGKSKLYIRWLPYVLAFLFSISALAGMEKALFFRPGGFLVFFAGMAFLLALLEVHQRRSIYETRILVYEEEPEPVMVTL